MNTNVLRTPSFKSAFAVLSAVAAIGFFGAGAAQAQTLYTPTTGNTGNTGGTTTTSTTLPGLTSGGNSFTGSGGHTNLITGAPEPGIIVTSLSMAGLTAAGLVRGRRRRSTESK